MVQAGMPVDIVDGDGSTALIKAAFNNQTDVVRYLLNNDANMNKQDRWGMTALHGASCHNQTDVMRILLEHGPRKVFKDKLGNTPIELARSLSNKEAVDLLEQY